MIEQNYSTILSRTKIFSHPDRLAEWLSTGITKPITAQLDPSNRCNYDCTQCAGLRIDRNAEMSLVQMRKIIDELYPFIRGIEITGGGESLMNKETPDAIIYAKEKNIDVGLITHGHLLNEITIPKIVSSTAYIRVSVDASDNHTHKIRKGTRDNSSLDRVINNIRNLVKEKRAQNAECTIGMSYLTDFEDTPETLRKFVELAKSVEVDYAQFRPYHHSMKDFMPYFEQLSDLNTKDFRVIFSKDKYEKKKFSYEKAFADEFRTVIAATGEIYPDCFTRGIKNFSFGNLLTESFEDIWNSQRRKDVFNTKLQQPNCPKQCYYDPLDQLLWEMYIQNRDVMHKNFI